VQIGKTLILKRSLSRFLWLFVGNKKKLSQATYQMFGFRWHADSMADILILWKTGKESWSIVINLKPN